MSKKTLLLASLRIFQACGKSGEKKTNRKKSEGWCIYYECLKKKPRHMDELKIVMAEHVRPHEANAKITIYRYMLLQYRLIQTRMQVG